MANLPKRKWLYHEVPSWVKDNPTFFITICCQNRTSNQLCLAPNAEAILKTVDYYHQKNIWYVRIWLLMPDHIHAVITPSPPKRLKQIIQNWKRYTSKNFDLHWQEGFFDHRLRDANSLEEKISYIRLNPVRSGLVEKANQWPYKFER